MLRHRASRGPGQGRAGTLFRRAAWLAVGAALLAPPPAPAQPDSPVRILGFRREVRGAGVDLIIACSRPVSFAFTSPALELIRLEVHGLDPTGVTSPQEAWGQDVASVQLSPLEGTDPGAVLEIRLREFVPYTVRSAGNELRVELEVGPDAPSAANSGPARQPPPPTPPAPKPTPTLAPAPAVTPAPAPPAAAEPAAEPDVVAPDFLDEPAPKPAPPAAEPTPPPAAESAPPPAPAPPAETAPAPAPAPDAPAVAAPASGGGSAGDGPAATRVLEVARADRDGVLAIRIPTNGRAVYKAFFTEDAPIRLVIDIEGTESRPLFQRLPVGVGGVRRVRVGQHQSEPVPVVRIVVDLDERVSHRIETDAEGLTLIFDGVSTQS